MYIFHLHVNFQYISWSIWYIYKIDIYRRVINPCVGTPIQYTLPSLFVLLGSASGQVYISWSLWCMYPGTYIMIIVIHVPGIYYDHCDTCTRYIYHDHCDKCSKLTFIVGIYIHVLVLLYNTRDCLFFVLLGFAPGLLAVSVPGIYIMIILIHVPNWHLS